jgi:hypothetical protein
LRSRIAASAAARVASRRARSRAPVVGAHEPQPVVERVGPLLDQLHEHADRLLEAAAVEQLLREQVAPLDREAARALPHEQQLDGVVEAVEAMEEVVGDAAQHRLVVRPSASSAFAAAAKSPPPSRARSCRCGRRRSRAPATRRRASRRAAP